VLTLSSSARDPKQTLRSALTLPNEPSEVGLAWKNNARRQGSFDGEFVAIHPIVMSLFGAVPPAVEPRSATQRPTMSGSNRIHWSPNALIMLIATTHTLLSTVDPA